MSNTVQIPEDDFVWTDDLVKKYAELYRFFSTRLSIELFKHDPKWASDHAIDKNYELAMAETYEQKLKDFREKLKNITVDELLKNTGIVIELFDEEFGIKK